MAQPCADHMVVIRREAVENAHQIDSQIQIIVCATEEPRSLRQFPLPEQFYGALDLILRSAQQQLGTLVDDLESMLFGMGALPFRLLQREQFIRTKIALVI